MEGLRNRSGTCCRIQVDSSRWLWIAAAISIFVLLTSLATAEDCVLAVALSDAITPASDDIIIEAIDSAESQGCQALMIILDTPGGGLQETTEIMGQIERTDLPVIGYVYPSGATAWSAGTLILLSSDVAAMAPYTIIGSAQPVQLSPTGVEPINDTKTTNAIVALIEEKARMHQRNTTAAREFVLSNLNLNAETAKEYGVIEFVSSDPEALLKEVDGLSVKNRTLITKNAEIIYFQPSPGLQLLEVLSDPMIAGLLLLVGLYSLIFGLSNPGIGAELFGVIALSLGLIGLGFSVNVGAVFLILLGIALIMLELHSPGFGVMGLAGLVCLAAGSILTVPISYPEYYLPAEYQQNLAIMFMVPSLVIGGFFALVFYKVARVRATPPVTGTIIGGEAEALDRLSPRGHVIYQGEYWLAESDEPVDPGERVVILEKDGSVLKVRRR